MSKLMVKNPTSITELKRTLRALKESKEMYAGLFDLSPDPIFIAQDKRFKLVNSRFTELFGYTQDDIDRGLSIFALLQEQDIETTRKRLEDRLAGKEVIPAKHAIDLIAKDGSIIPCETSAALSSYKGRPAALVIIRDMVERKRTMEALFESRERYRDLVETVNDVIWEVDVNGIYTFLSPRVEDLLGHKPEEMLGRPFTYKMLPEEENRLKDIFMGFVSQLKNFTYLESTVINKEGYPVILENSGKPFFDADCTLRGFRGVYRDITERKRSEEALRKSEQRFRLLIDNYNAPICLFDLNGTTLVMNHVSAANFGGKPEDFVGKKVSDYFSMGDQLVERHRKVIDSGKAAHFMDKIKLPAGERWYGTHIQPVKDENGKAYAVQCLSYDITKRKQAEEELRSHRDQLEELVSERTKELSKTNEELNREISERKQAEEALSRAYLDLKLTQAQLIQSAKLASIGELAAGVAHELNQPLMVIRGTAQLLSRKFQKTNPGPEELKADLDVVERNTKRMMNIISHLRTFSRQSSKEFSPQDINKLIDNCFLMVGEQLRLHNIEVKKDLSQDLSKVKGDASQLEQIFLNLIINAKDAIEEKSQQVESEGWGEKYQGKMGIVTRANENFIEILVKDNGCGLSAENREKIFDPFFTSKEVGKGTGLGLSISYGIIKDHEGQIELAETGPDGTTFRIKLPYLKR